MFDFVLSMTNHQYFGGKIKRGPKLRWSPPMFQFQYACPHSGAMTIGLG